MKIKLLLLFAFLFVATMSVRGIELSVGERYTCDLYELVTSGLNAKNITWIVDDGLEVVSNDDGFRQICFKTYKSGSYQVYVKWSEYRGAYPYQEKVSTKGHGWTFTCTKPVEVKINSTNFPDANFRDYLLEQDYGKDGVLTDGEIKYISSITCYGKKIQSLKGIEFFTELEYLACNNNELTALDVSKNTKLTELRCVFNQIKGKAMDGLIASLPKNNSAEKYKFGVISKNSLEGNVCTKAQVAAAKARGWQPFDYYGNEYEGSEDVPVGIEINATNFPDENFRKFLLEQDYGKDGVLTDSEIKSVTAIDCNSRDIKSLKGIEFFTSLTYLSCGGNNLTALDMSKNTSLTDLFCSLNQLTLLDVSKNTALKWLWCDQNQLTAMDLSKNTSLTSLWCFRNQLTSLDVSKNTALTELWCPENQLTTLDISKNTRLEELYCDDNQLTSLDVSKNMALTKLYCYRNQIKGKAMDGLIASLPTNGSDVQNELRVMTNNENEGNVCTNAQAATAKDRGWKPLQYDGAQWIEISSTVAPVSITLPTKESVVAGETITLTAEMMPEGAVSRLTWTSDDETIAVVNEKGEVTGIKVGQTFINVQTDNGQTGWCKLTVTQPSVSQIVIPEKETVSRDETITLTATLLPEGATGTITWTSDDETIARVNAKGEVMGIKEGLAIIYAIAENGVRSNPCKLKVDVPAGILDVKSAAVFNVYTQAGVLLRREVTTLKGLAKGVYIVTSPDGRRTQKVVVK